MKFISIDWKYRENASTVTFSRAFHAADKEAQLDVLQDALRELELKFDALLADIRKS
jgi:hypothetical protein